MLEYSITIDCNTPPLLRLIIKLERFVKIKNNND